jgi:plasmid stabilization system protein ParE
MRIVVSPVARRDLLQIVTHLAVVAGPATADRWDQKLWRAIDEISESPGSGPPRPALGEHTRIVVVHPYIVIYDHVRGSGSLQVLRVVHGRRNITRDLLRDGDG